MKKLNKQQKQQLKQSLMKGLNITCYIVAGLSVALGLLVGIKSCSDKKKSNVTTTPVVSEVLSRKDLIYTQPEDHTSVSYGSNVVDFMRYINGASYKVDGRDYNDWVTWGSLSGKTLISYDSEASGNPIHIRQWSRSNGWYSDYYCYKLNFGSNNQLRSYTRGSSGYSTIDPTMMANGNSGYYELYIDFAQVSVSDSWNVTLLSHSTSNTKSKDFYTFMSDHLLTTWTQSSSWRSYSYSGDGAYYVASDYITPYGVYGGFEAEVEGFTTNAPYCIFDGVFTLGNKTYTNIFVETTTLTVNTVVFGAPDYHTIMKDIVYYNRNTGDSLIVAKSNYDTVSLFQFDMIDWANNNIRWSWLNFDYSRIYIKTINSGYASGFGYNDNSGDAFWGLNQTFSGDYNVYTQAPGTVDNGNGDIPNYNGTDAGQIAWNSVFGLLGSAFASMASVFNFYILPGVSVGTLLFLPLVVTIVIFIIWLIKR